MVDMARFKAKARADGHKPRHIDRAPIADLAREANAGTRSEIHQHQRASHEDRNATGVAEDKRKGGGRPPSTSKSSRQIVEARRMSLHGKPLEKVELTRYEKLTIGQLSFGDLDDKEIFLRCTREYCEDGTMDFPKMAPILNRKMLEGFDRELMERVHKKIRTGLLKSFDTVMHVLEYGELDKDRLKAAELFINRALGRPRETVDMNVSTPYDNLLREYLEMKIEKERKARALDAQFTEEGDYAVITDES